MGQPIVKVIAHSVFDQSLRLYCGEAVFGLTDEFRLADKTADEGAAACDQIFAGDLCGFFVACQFPIGADAFENGGPKSRLMRAAFGGGDGVTIGLDEPIARGRPIDGPFDFARHAEFFLEIDDTGKGRIGIG